MRKFLKILGIILLAIFLIFAISFAVLFIKAKAWRTSFESNIQENSLVSSVSESNDILNEKIETYILSEEDVNFIEFTPTEISQYLFNILTEMTEETPLNLLKIYIEPMEDIWKVCGLVSFNGLRPWVCMDVTKDDMQTAQLYVNDITVEGIDVDGIFPSILTKVNQGIAEALVTANENGFVGRLLENIELQEEGLIVKGSIY